MKIIEENLVSTSERIYNGKGTAILSDDTIKVKKVKRKTNNEKMAACILCPGK